MAVEVGPTRFDGHAARVTVTVDGTPREISLTSRTRLSATKYWADVWLPLALFPAMRTGQPLRLADRMSAGLALNIETLQRILSTFHPGLSVVEVHAPLRSERLGWGRRAQLQAFTGGVDSFYTLTTHPTIDTLVYVHDLVHDVPEVRNRATALIDSVATRSGKRALHIESDVRSMFDLYAEWGLQGHGPAMASVAAFVSRGSTDFYLPASHTYLELHPRGSHAALDNWWGSHTRRILHDGAYATRLEKVKALASNPLALRHLRVCFMTTTELNCSRCAKCVRTMVSLDLAGVLEQAPTFHGALDSDLILSHPIRGPSDLSFAVDNLSAARRLGREDLAAPLANLIADYEAG
jgi:hypothetical protein